MSAVNSAWNGMGAKQATGWNDPRAQYQSPHPQGLQPIRQRPAPRYIDLPVALADELAQDVSKQRMWDNMTSEDQWHLLERFKKQAEVERREAIANAYDPNKDEAYSVSLSTAVDLWRIKHGDAWVRAHEVYAEGDLYGELQHRLTLNHCFEVMSKHERQWVRLKENL